MKSSRGAAEKRFETTYILSCFYRFPAVFTGFQCSVRAMCSFIVLELPSFEDDWKTTGIYNHNSKFKYVWRVPSPCPFISASDPGA